MKLVNKTISHKIDLLLLSVDVGADFFFATITILTEAKRSQTVVNKVTKNPAHFKKVLLLFLYAIGIYVLCRKLYQVCVSLKNNFYFFVQSFFKLIFEFFHYFLVQSICLWLLSKIRSADPNLQLVSTRTILVHFPTSAQRCILVKSCPISN